MRRLFLLLLWLAPGFVRLYAADSKGKEFCQKNFAGYKDRIAKNPSDDEAWTEFRVCSAELKRWDEAIQVAIQARQKNRDLSQPYLVLGFAQMQQRNYERAVEHFDQSIALKSDQPIAYFQMGMAYLFLNEPTKAALAAGRAVELEPSNPSHHRQLAYAQLLLGDFEPAELSAKKAIELDKNDLAAHKILAKIYGKEGKTTAMNDELAVVKTAEDKVLAAHPELAKKVEIAPKSQEVDKEEKKPEKQEDYEVVGLFILQWNKMKDAIARGDVDEALTYYSDYLDTRDQYRESFNRLGLARLQSIFSSFGDLYDCEVVFSSGRCKSLVKNATGTVVVTTLRFERNPNRVWRIRSF